MSEDDHKELERLLDNYCEAITGLSTWSFIGHERQQEARQALIAFVDRLANSQLREVATYARESLRQVINLANVNDETRKILITTGNALNDALKGDRLTEKGEK